MKKEEIHLNDIGRILFGHEMVAMVTLAATIGIPLQTPDCGLLPALMISVIVVLIGRWIALKAFNDQHFEKISQGNVASFIVLEL